MHHPRDPPLLFRHLLLIILRLSSRIASGIQPRSQTGMIRHADADVSLVPNEDVTHIEYGADFDGRRDDRLILEHRCDDGVSD